MLNGTKYVQFQLFSKLCFRWRKSDVQWLKTDVHHSTVRGRSVQVSACTLHELVELQCCPPRSQWYSDCNATVATSSSADGIKQAQNADETTACSTTGTYIRTTLYERQYLYQSACHLHPSLQVTRCYKGTSPSSFQHNANKCIQFCLLWQPAGRQEVNTWARRSGVQSHRWGMFHLLHPPSQHPAMLIETSRMSETGRNLWLKFWKSQELKIWCSSHKWISCPENTECGIVSLDAWCQGPAPWPARAPNRPLMTITCCALHDQIWEWTFTFDSLWPTSISCVRTLERLREFPLSKDYALQSSSSELGSHCVWNIKVIWIYEIWSPRSNLPTANLFWAKRNSWFIVTAPSRISISKTYRISRDIAQKFISYTMDMDIK